MVVDALGGDEMAPMYIMRLWAHCQNRKGDTFAIPCAGIKALCKFPGDASELEKALIDAEYLARDGDKVTVIGWAERNGSLIAAWENGGRGGRPKKPTDNPRETQGEPMGNPTVTHREPNANPRETDKSREDKRREEGKEKPPAGVSQLSIPDLVADGLSEATAAEWVAHRKAKKAKLTPLAWQGFKDESAKAGWALEDSVKKAIHRNWTSCQAEWLRTEFAQQGAPPNRQEALEERNRAIGAQWLAEQGIHPS